MSPIDNRGLTTEVKIQQSVIKLTIGTDKKIDFKIMEGIGNNNKAKEVTNQQLKDNRIKADNGTKKWCLNDKSYWWNYYYYY